MTTTNQSNKKDKEIVRQYNNIMSSKSPFIIFQIKNGKNAEISMSNFLCMIQANMIQEYLLIHKNK